MSLSVMLSEVEASRAAFLCRVIRKHHGAKECAARSFASLRMTGAVLVVFLMFASAAFAQSSYGGNNGVANPTFNGSGCTTSGTAVLKGNGAGGCANATSSSDFAPPT